MRRLALVLVSIALSTFATRAGQGGTAVEDLDAAFAAFWDAEDPDAAEQKAQRILETAADFDAVWRRLRAGRTYRKEATGVREMPTTVAGKRLDNIVEIPADYDPARRWPLRVQLHGGVGRLAPRAGEPVERPLTNNRIPGGSQISLHPRAWADSKWWQANQVDNISKLVDAVKRRYNVDESHVHVTGISDGGTGVYFLAMRAATLWAACLPLNGGPRALGTREAGADHQLFIGNLVNCPMYVVNGGRDPLYPADAILPVINMMKRAAVSVEFHVHPEAGHNTSWWPVERPLYEQYLAAHPRAAHPERVSWETDQVTRYNRFRWLIINGLGRRSSDVDLEDVNSFEYNGVTMTMYPRTRPSGRVDIVRRGNTFEARTRGVRQFTLLLSPDVIDFTKPVRVTVNGQVAFEGGVKQDIATLLAWAARDNDRTTLYGSELAIVVP
jgi:dienelactone hydrolase